MHKHLRAWMHKRILKTWKLLSSENITFLHYLVVQCACFFAKARRCFFILLLIRGFLAALRLGRSNLSEGDAGLFGFLSVAAALGRDFAAPSLSNEGSFEILVS